VVALTETIHINRERFSRLTQRERCDALRGMIPRKAGWLTVLGTVLLIGSVANVGADVRLPGVFSDHMVLQQDLRLPIWGWADEGERVTVTFRGSSASTTARDGSWTLRLPRQKAGGPFRMVVEGKNRIEIEDVLVGEVWVCSGQSNMEWPMSRSFEPESDIANSANPNLRLLTVPKLKAETPTNNINAAWVVCEPDTVRNFSAVAYYFGRDLQLARGVPVGLINTSWGGSPVEVWIRHELLAAHPDYKRDILDPYPAQARRYQDELAKWETEAEALRKEGKEPARGRPWATWRPSELYNGMIAPLVPYGIRGAIWYQGESNADRAWQYRTLYPDMIRNWRVDWDQGDFTFLAVQLAPWDRNRNRLPQEIAAEIGESSWAELREAQVLSTKVLPAVGLAVITDVGDKDDIHPARKAPVGGRLALLARSIAHGERLVANGPLYRRMKVKKGTVTLEFDHAGAGLESRGGNLRGFTICGEDRKFLPAIAEIQGRKVVVHTPLVPEPVAVRYGWADYPIVNLFNREGLPASPFRTDDFPMTTAPRE
jgi:sialate O-acetylesterase